MPTVSEREYLHTLPDADAKNLDALNRTRGQHGSADPGEHSNTSPPAHARSDDS